MSSLKSLAAEDRERCFNLICEAGDIRTRQDLLSWLREDVQTFLPHEILIAAWGDFQRCAVQYDIVFASDSMTVGGDLMALALHIRELHARWSITQKRPFATDATPLHKLLKGGGYIEPVWGESAPRTALVHGVSDLREQQDYVYVILSRGVGQDENSKRRLGVLVQHIDVAFRQIPNRGVRSMAAVAVKGKSRYASTEAPQITIARPSQEPDVGITEREQQIMKWVEMGKTNHEIGAILDISAFTVKNHLQRIFKKLDVYNRAQAVSRFKDGYYAHG